MKIAVTGANGFIGSNLTAYLASEGQQVRAIIRPGADSSLLSSSIQICSVDYHIPDTLSQALAGCDVLIHNAGMTRSRAHLEMIEANVGLTRAMVAAANATAGLKRFVLMSSQAASRPSETGEPVSEDDPEAPLTWYGKSKLLAERVVQRDCTAPWTIIRPVSVYGGGDRDFLQMFKAARLGIALRIGKRQRMINMIHISELIDFIYTAITSREAENQVFFASDGGSYTQSEVSCTISGLTGRSSRQITIPDPLARLAFSMGEMFVPASGKAGVLNRQKMLEIMAPNWTCSIAKAKALLGWEPTPRLRENLMETYTWYREHGWL